MATIGLHESRRQFESSFSVGVERIAFSEIISAFSYALDLTEDAVPGHAVRSCLLGMRIGWALGLSETQLTDLYYALLLKDISGSRNSSRMCQVSGRDDRTVKKEGKRAVCAPAGVSAWRKAGLFFSHAFQQHRDDPELTDLRSERGADLVRKIGLSEQCANAIHSVDEHWNGCGSPARPFGENVPLLARILGVAQHLDVFGTEEGRDRAIETLKEKSGTWFDPDLVRIAVSLHRYGKLWIGCGTPDERSRAMGLEPGSVRTIVADQVDRICEAFGEVVDAKSSYTYRHSLGVTDLAAGMSRHFGLPSARRRLIYRAALLHDLGKLRVPNSILDKPGKLDEAEWLVMREHPFYSQQIIERIPSFAAIAGIAGRHHEKLDGSGYPNQLKSNDLSLEDRILALADVYTGLSEDRPYRKAMAPEQIFAFLRQRAPLKYDPDCLDALIATVERHPSSPVVAYAAERLESAIFADACAR